MKTFLITILILSAINSADPQSRYRNVLISKESSPNEPSIFINPNNTYHIVAASNMDAYYYTFDGGETWTKGTLISSTYGVWGDPCIVMDTKGNFYYFHIVNSGGYWFDRIVCQKSTNGGVSWSNPGTFTGHNPPHIQDKEWAAIDMTDSPYRDNIYVAWTQCGQPDSSHILYSRSTDGGESWNDFMRLNKIAGDNCYNVPSTVLGAAPCVGTNGNVYVCWSSANGIILDKSIDGGVTWLDEDILVNPQPKGFRFEVPGVYRCFGFSSMACDQSNSKYNGTLYICWADQRNGKADTDIWLAKSTDGGLTWSDAKRINDDSPGKHQFFPWLTVDQKTGYIYIVFYDRRNYNDPQTDVYLARSADGGETFTNERISESPFTPNQHTFMGDYINISAHDGKIRPIWTRMDTNIDYEHNSGVLSVWTAIINE